MPNYESRLKIQAEWMSVVWRLVDHYKVRAQIAALIESELAERMVNHMAAVMKAGDS